MTKRAWGHRTGLTQWMTDAVPPDIADDLRHAQLDSLVTQVPVLMAVAALNVMIIMAVSAWNGLPLRQYGWMSGLIIYTLVRGYFVKRGFAAAVTAERQRGIIRTSTYASIGMLAILGFAAAITYVAGLFERSLLIPMSLGFGSISIAHCLYRLRRVALAAIALGIGPTALVLLAIGDFEAKMLGVSMISVGWLMIRFVSTQRQQLIDNLRLHRHIREMAHSDPLTGLANRRAVDAFLHQADGDGLAVALIDLDDFKQVNDSHGHDVGDALLALVAERLRAAVPAPGLVGRLGGDEFIVILTGIADDTELGAIATGLLAALCLPARVGGLPLRLGASIGHALRQDGRESSAELLKRADRALYAAKGMRAQPMGPLAARMG